MSNVIGTRLGNTVTSDIAWRYAEFGNHRVYFQRFGEGWRGIIVPLKVGAYQRARTRSVYGENLEDVTRKAEDFIRNALPVWSRVARGLSNQSGLLRLGQGRDLTAR